MWSLFLWQTWNPLSLSLKFPLEIFYRLAVGIPMSQVLFNLQNHINGNLMVKGLIVSPCLHICWLRCKLRLESPSCTVKPCTVRTVRLVRFGGERKFLYYQLDLSPLVFGCCNDSRVMYTYDIEHRSKAESLYVSVKCSVEGN